MIGWERLDKRTSTPSKIRSMRAWLTMLTTEGPVFGGVETDNALYVPRTICNSYLEVRGGETIPWSCTAGMRGDLDHSIWNSLRPAHSGILFLACGLGKTVHALRKIAYEKRKALIVVPTKDLAEQWKQEALRWLTINGSPITEKDIGSYFGGVVQLEKPLVIASIQTLSDKGLPPAIHRSFGMVVHDEAHHLSAPTWYKAAATGLHQRLALTATPYNDDNTHRLWMAHFGSIIYQHDQQERSPECFFIPFTSGIDIADRSLYAANKELSIPLLYGRIGQHEERNQLIVDLIKQATNKDRKVLCLSFSKSHCATLADMVENSGLCTGDIKDQKKRRSNLHEYPVVFGTTTLAKEGLDRKELDTLILMTPFSKKTLLTQAAGRILRNAGKSPLILVIQDDDIPPFSHMCRKMRNIFKDQGYKVTIRRKSAS